MERHALQTADEVKKVPALMTGEQDAPLTAEEVRVLGSLMEKAMSTPEYYPLTLRALTAACNQKSNRNPVTSYDERVVLRAVDRLRERKLAVLVHQAGARVVKYAHQADQTWGLTEVQAALLCELLLRGPQTTAELRTRAFRLYPMPADPEVESALRGMADRDPPLVVLLPREPGRRERRWTHLLCTKPTELETQAADSVAPPPPSLIDQEAERLRRLEERVTALEASLERLRSAFEAFRAELE